MRQYGREAADSVIHCKAQLSSIDKAIESHIRRVPDSLLKSN